MDMNLSDKIKKLAEENGTSNAELARISGVSRSAVTKWFNGTNQPKANVIPALANHFNVPVDYLLEEKSVSSDGSNPNVTKYIYEVSAGNGRFNDGYEAVINDDDYSTVRICGDSMYPSLHDGDIVKVLHTKEVHPKDFAIVKINGDESTCKHVELQTDGVWLRAENKDVFEDRFYNAKDVMTLPVTIIGIATEIVSRKL